MARPYQEVFADRYADCNKVYMKEKITMMNVIVPLTRGDDVYQK